MAKNKLQRFEENKSFTNMFQLSYEESRDSFSLKGKWRDEFFKNNNPIVLELGCGKGEYTVGLARKYPNKNFIGVDIKGARMWRGCKTSVEENLENVAFIRTHIQMIENYFSPNEVDEIWITFPDPQIKKPNKRLTSPRFLSFFKNIIKPNAILHLKTDSAELYEYTLNEVIIPEKHIVEFHTNDLYNSGFTQDVMDVQTFYETMFLAQNKKITYIQFCLKQ